MDSIRALVVAVLAGTFVGCHHSAEKNVLDGTWDVMSNHSSGDELNIGPLNYQWVFSGKEGKTLFNGKERKRWTIQLDPAQSPPAIDFSSTEKDGESKVLRGIYELHGDDLKLCTWAEKEDGTRPKEFTSTKEYRTQLTILKRHKP
jgi:uncharacterized protein (TIGR03067 family)